MEQILPGEPPMEHLTPQSFNELRELDREAAQIHLDLKSIFDDNFDDDSVPTPLLAMAEYAFWATAKRENEVDSVRRLVAYLEARISDGPQIVVDCISLMFLENLVGEPEMIRLLGPELRSAMRRVTGI
jgi:hypothetical protein